MNNDKRSVKIVLQKKCRYCNETFQPRTKRALYCSEACRSYYSRDLREKMGIKGKQGFSRKNTLSGENRAVVLQTEKKPVAPPVNAKDKVIDLLIQAGINIGQNYINRIDKTSTHNKATRAEEKIDIVINMMYQLHQENKRLENKLDNFIRESKQNDTYM